MVLGISEKYSHVLYGLLCLLNMLSTYCVFTVHLHCDRDQKFVPSSVWIIFHCMDIPHFVYSPNGEHLGCSCWLLWIVLHFNTCIQFFFFFNEHISWIYLGVELLGHKAMAPPSSTLAWKIPWVEEPGRVQSMGLLESDTTGQLHFHFSLSCLGEGNGNPLQCSCLENPRDRGAWWAAVYGVTQSWTRLKWLSSSSSKANSVFICI